MHGRKLVTTGTVAALAILAIVGGCREATTGPSSVKPQDFAASVKLLSGNLQSGAVGAALPEILSVKVVDAGGVPVPGATVLWQVRGGGGTINPPASTTSSTGLANVTWTLGTSLGGNTAVALLQGNYVLDSVVFTATAVTGPAQKFVATGGNLQIARVASMLPQALVVNVKDQFGYPVQGARVTWAAALFSGTVTPLIDSTDASGNASTIWTLGTSAIAQSVTATVTGLTPIVFTATGTPDVSRRVTLTAATGSGLKDPIGAAISLSVIVTDSFLNPIKSDVVVFSDSVTSGGSVSSAAPSTDAAGRATAVWTLGARPGLQVVRARVGSTPSNVVSDTATIQFAQVYAGNYFTCGVTTGDRAFCWGFGEDGQRGISAAKTANAPGAAVTTGDTLSGPFLTFRQISAGTSYICGISIARQLYCWGRLASGSPSNVPTLTPGPTAVQSFQSVSTSDTHSCLITTEGELACAGSNSQGQLGDGTKGDHASYSLAATAAPLAAQRWSAVAVGGAHTCAFMQFNPNTAVAAPADSASTSVPWCWGANGSGQLGYGVALTANSLVPTRILSAIAFDSTSLVAGALHTCALSRAGVAYCWGSNAFGQLGKAIAGAARDSLPQAVAMPAGVTAFSKLYAGEYHTCGIELTAPGTGGRAYCWGRNSSGQLGDGTTTTPAGGTFIQVSPGKTWRSLALGELHSCGVATPTGAESGTQAGAGVIYCWGDNEYGQLGIGTSGQNGVAVPPTKVVGQP
jgi:alpha-tubulin suppressor-like RCC1 family protein